MAREYRALVERHAASNGRQCPHCGAREGIDWNGFSGAGSAYACHGGNGCGEQWDAEDYRLTEDELETLRD